ncbi:MAG TPA: JAB domain-containing protein, partial [Chthoniobacteraceae bacterium]|nr:JAB domain-containing protein [Chthoniobacteraceae bacterium]
AFVVIARGRGLPGYYRVCCNRQARARTSAVEGVPANPFMRFIVRDYSILKLGEEQAAPAQGDTPEGIYQYFRNVIEKDPGHEPDKEHLVVLFLNTRLQIFGWHLACLGTLNEVSFHPREILRPTIMAGAYGFTLFHNHPSGDPTPSISDDRCTRRLAAAADVVEVRLLDHVIVGKPSCGRKPWHSFRERGVIV